MTAIALPSGRAYPPYSFVRLLLNLIHTFREAQQISYRYEQLTHLSDAELTARKIRREDLARIAYTGRNAA